jgi:hypothetical protein
MVNRLRLPDAHLTLNGWNIPFVKHVKYLDVIFDKRIRWRLHIEMIEAKDFRTVIGLYTLLKSESLSANIKLILLKALIRSVMTYACPVWKFEADNHILKLQYLRKKIFHIIGKFSSYTTACGFHTAFNLPYVYSYVTKLCSNKQRSYKIMRMKMFEV